MNLTKHYRKLYKSSIGKIEKGDYKIDSLIDSPNDKRYGITILIRPPEKIKDKIELILNKLKHSDPNQYYYPKTDIHITVMSIISCYEGFQLDRISIPDYHDLIKRSLKGIDKFGIKCKGITASDSGLMIQGFPENNTLSNLRNNLRVNFTNSDLEQSIDKRYAIQTAHSTVVRFRSELKNMEGFLAVAENYKNYDFGDFQVDELELVFNDWYQRKSNSKLIDRFEL